MSRSRIDSDLTVRVFGPPLGSAPALLLVHGLTGSGRAWPDAVAHWQARFTLVAVDLRGHGQSPRFTTAELRAHPGEVMVADAVALLQQFRAPPVVVGHSLGAAVALDAAVRRPALVRGLVLEDPAPRHRAEPQRDHERGSELVAELAPDLAAPDDTALLAVRRKAHPRWSDEELLASGRAARETDLAYLGNGDRKPTASWQALFEAVSVPTLVVAGDTTRPEADVCVDDGMEAEITAMGNPWVRVERIPGAEHEVRRDEPERYYAVVDAWLHRLLGPGPGDSTTSASRGRPGPAL